MVVYITVAVTNRVATSTITNKYLDPQQFKSIKMASLNFYAKGILTAGFGGAFFSLAQTSHVSVTSPIALHKSSLSASAFLTKSNINELRRCKVAKLAMQLTSNLLNNRII